MIWILGGIAWWGSGAVAYFLTRKSYKVERRKWTVGDRNRMLFFSIVVPPSMLVAALLIYIDAIDTDKESSW
jgi:hypothetical protein